MAHSAPHVREDSGNESTRLYLAHVWLGALVLCLAIPAAPANFIVLLLATFISFGYLDERDREARLRQ